MDSFDFPCGGDHGAWDCIVTVPLSEEQQAHLREFAKKNDTLWPDPLVNDVYQVVKGELVQQCIDAYDNEYLEEIRDEYAISEDDPDHDVIERLLEAQGYVIRVPAEFLEDK